MNIPSKDLPDLQMDTTFTSPQGCAAAQRALDYYLKPAVSEPEVDERFFGVNSNLSGEESLVHASDLLRCAAATAFKAADSLRASIGIWRFRSCTWWTWRGRWLITRLMAQCAEDGSSNGRERIFQSRR